MSVAKSDREKASRLRRRERDEGELSARDARWLAKYDATRAAARASRPEPAREPDAVPVVAVEPVELVEIAAAAPPQATAGAPVATSPAVPGATPATLATPGIPAVPGGPLPSFHAPACTVADCPGCAGEMATGPQVCGKTGLQVYPKLSEVASRGFAGMLLWAVSGIVRLGAWFSTWITTGKGQAPAYVEPTRLERSELAEALRSIFRTRPWLGALGQAYGDVAACGAVVTTYGGRSMSGPAGLPADAGRDGGGS